ncbi:MAG: hypothetical protein VX278_04415 [Myxococcota bacterium]|nr:hypothetical protein [Myxococcota bacterium]
MFCFVSCTGEKDAIDSEGTVVVEDTNVETEDTGTSQPDDESEPTTFSSTLQATQTQVLLYDRDRTIDNPLKGFLTSYKWGEPSNAMPHRLEFAYVPLSDIVQSEGEYRFDSSVEPLLQQASDRGNHLIIRVYIDYPNLESGLPEYLLDIVSCSSYSDYGGGCSPDYQDPNLQSAILDFIGAFGAAYDGDRRLAFVQLGLLGFWGEWHTYPHVDWFAADGFQQEVIAAYGDAFQQTPLQIRVPVQDTPQRIIGFHDDSFAYSTLGDVDWFFWSKMMAAGTDRHWEHSPTGGEVFPALQAELFSEDYQVGEYSQDFAECVSQTHATYMINYNAFHSYSAEQQVQAEEISMSMGYEYTVEQVSVEVGALHDMTVDIRVSVFVRNSGVSPFYYPLHLTLHSEEGQTWLLQSELNELLPSAEAEEYAIVLESVPASLLKSNFFLSLDAEILLEEQRIRFANVEDIDGRIYTDVHFACQYDSESYGLGESYDEVCFCDVDGIFRTVVGEECE